MRLRVFRTASALRTDSPVIGQIPPLARVAAIILPDSQVTSMEQSCEEKSRSCQRFTYSWINIRPHNVNKRMFDESW